MRLSCCTAVLLVLLPLQAWATKPAVKALNGRLIAGYGFEHTNGSTQAVGGSLRVQPPSDENLWAVGGVLTAPVFVLLFLYDFHASHHTAADEPSTRLMARTYRCQWFKPCSSSARPSPVSE